MKRQDKSSTQPEYSVSTLHQLQLAYRRLEKALDRHPWLAQGSVNSVAPKSPGGNVTYTWTRKVRAKTVTVALSEAQAMLFRNAIAANRRMEEALAQLRDLSQTAMLRSLPGVSKRRTDSPGKSGAQTVPKGP